VSSGVSTGGDGGDASPPEFGEEGTPMYLSPPDFLDNVFIFGLHNVARKDLDRLVLRAEPCSIVFGCSIRNFDWPNITKLLS
jgi:hypothetical protein